MGAGAGRPQRRGSSNDNDTNGMSHDWEDYEEEDVEEDDETLSADNEEEDDEASERSLLGFINTIRMLRHGTRYQTNERAPSEFMKWPLKYRSP